MITWPRIRPPRTLRNPAPCPSSSAPSSPSPAPAPAHHSDCARRPRMGCSSPSVRSENGTPRPDAGGSGHSAREARVSGRGGPVARRGAHRRVAQRRGFTPRGGPPRPGTRPRVAGRSVGGWCHGRPAWNQRASPENPSPHVVVHTRNPTVFFAQIMTGFTGRVVRVDPPVGKQVFFDRTSESIMKDQVGL